MNDRTLGVIGITLITTLGLSPALTEPVQGFINSDPDPRKAPTFITADNVYVVWFTDKGMPNSNGEVIFRTSTDGGKTFGDKINLSNTTDADSINAEITAEGAKVAVTWWERDQTSSVPVTKVSNDNGKTFGPLLELGANGTIGTGEAKPII